MTCPGCAPTDLPGFLALGAEAAHQLPCHGAASVPPVALEALERGRGHLVIQTVGEVAQDTDGVLHALGGTGDMRVSSLGHPGCVQLAQQLHERVTTLAGARLVLPA